MPKQATPKAGLKQTGHAHVGSTNVGQAEVLGQANGDHKQSKPRQKINRYKNILEQTKLVIGYFQKWDCN